MRMESFKPSVYLGAGAVALLGILAFVAPAYASSSGLSGYHQNYYPPYYYPYAGNFNNEFNQNLLNNQPYGQYNPSQYGYNNYYGNPYQYNEGIGPGLPRLVLPASVFASVYNYDRQPYAPMPPYYGGMPRLQFPPSAYYPYASYSYGSYPWYYGR